MRPTKDEIIFVVVVALILSVGAAVKSHRAANAVPKPFSDKPAPPAEYQKAGY